MATNCTSCKEPNKEEAKFCSKCGANIVKSNLNLKISSLNAVIAFYVLMIIFIAVAYFISLNYPASFASDITIEILFAALIIGFSLTNAKELIKLYKLPKISLTALLLIGIIPVCTAFLIYHGVTYFESVFNPESSNNYFSAYLYLDNPLAWSIFFIAILPPIFEELAFRGYLFNQLKKITSEKITIIATASLFALVHFSFISILWIFPFGVFLGYLRKRYNTLWLSMMVHFIHNLIVLILDYYEYTSLTFEQIS